MNRTTLLKSIAASVAALSLYSAPVAATTNPIALTVRVDNVQLGAGPVRVAMFERAHWLGNTVVDADETAASAASVQVQLTAARAGRYGLAVYQDINRDGRLNRNLVGIPSEPVAFSNNAVIRFGPPSFDASALDISANAQTVVSFPQ